MSNYQYSGGVGAALARALTGAGQGYEQSIDDRARRKQQEATTELTRAQTENQKFEPTKAIADWTQHIMDQYPGIDPLAAQNLARQMAGQTPIPAQQAPLPTHDVMSNLPPPRPLIQPPSQIGSNVQPIGLPPQAGGNLLKAGPRINDILSTSVAPPVPSPNALARPVGPPPAPTGLIAMPGDTQVMPPTGLVAHPGDWVPPPRTEQQLPPPMQAPDWQAPDAAPNVPGPTTATAPPNVPTPTSSPPPAPPGYVPFDMTKPLESQYGPTADMRRTTALIEGRQSVASGKNATALQKTFDIAVGAIGILPTDSDATKANKLQQQIAKATEYDQLNGGHNFTDYVMQSGGILSTNKDAIASGRAQSYSDIVAARIPEITAQAGLAKARTGYVDAQTGQVVPDAQAKRRLQQATAGFLTAKTGEVVPLAEAEIAYKSALGASSTANADTNRYNSQTRSALATATIQHLASATKMDAARIEEIANKDPNFVQAVKLLQDAVDRKQKAQTYIFNPKLREDAIANADKDIETYGSVVKGRLNGSSNNAPPATAAPTSSVQPPTVPNVGGNHVVTPAEARAELARRRGHH